jgi:hypothetical protein
MRRRRDRDGDAKGKDAIGNGRNREKGAIGKDAIGNAMDAIEKELTGSWRNRERSGRNRDGTKDAVEKEWKRSQRNLGEHTGSRERRKMKGEVWGGFSLLFCYYMSRFYLYKVKLSVSRYGARARAHGVGGNCA